VDQAHVPLPVSPDLVIVIVSKNDQAEECDVTKSNLGQMMKSGNRVIRRLLGAQRNYGEIFERGLGSGSERKLPRGPNKLWTQGGLMYALPMR